MASEHREIKNVVNSIADDAVQDITANVFAIFDEVAKKHREAITVLIEALEFFHEDVHGTALTIRQCHNPPCRDIYNIIAESTR